MSENLFDECLISNIFIFTSFQVDEIEVLMRMFSKWDSRNLWEEAPGST